MNRSLRKAENFVLFQRKAHQAQQELKEERCTVDCEWGSCVVNGHFEVISLILTDAALAKGSAFVGEVAQSLTNIAIKAAMQHANDKMTNAMTGIELEIRDYPLSDSTPVVVQCNIPVFIANLTDEHKRLADILILPHQNNYSDSTYFSLEKLCEVHKELLHGSEHAFHAGHIRTIPIVAGAATFPPAHLVDNLMHDSFRPLQHPILIIDWTIYCISTIHPFVDGNRRTFWLFANRFLQNSGYRSIDWEVLRPEWEKTIGMHYMKRAKALCCCVIGHYSRCE